MGTRTGFAAVDGQASSTIDLHLHSHASGAATNWWVRGLGLGVEARESFTPPDDAYAMVKRAGMDFATLTDHETIEGALTLTGRPDFLVGEEISAVFPEDGGTVDVLVFGLSSEDHRELQSRRENVYRLVDYLRDAALVHVLAHPMFAVGAPLTRVGVEKRLVLFGLWEFVNGSRPVLQNRLTRDVALGVGPIELRQMASRHGLAIPPHRGIGGTAGSDDHGGIYGGAAYTVLPKVESVTDLLAAMAAGEVRPAGEDGSPEKMVHTAFKIAGATFLEGAASAQDAAGGEGGERGGNAGPATPTSQVLEYLPLLPFLSGAQIRGALVGRYERRLADALNTTRTPFPALGLLGSIGQLVESHLFVAPYVGVHGYFGRENEKAKALRRHLFPDHRRAIKVGVFVDEMDEIHGVATMYHNLRLLAKRPGEDRFRLIRCGAADDTGGHAVRAVATVPMPLYPGRTLAVPSLLDVVDHVAEQEYDVLHVAAPGPLGLAALFAGSTLGIPVVGAYHTEFGSYAEILSGDALVAELVELVVREFYSHCAAVAVSSRSTAGALQSRGYRIGRYEILKNGVDTRLFAPAKRDGAWRAAAGGGRRLLLYAGRVSKEKGLERLAEGYLALRQRRDDVHLVVAGDGPYRVALEQRLGDAATFTGFLRGDDLARVFASSDVFVFPSLTDTLGRAVIEAQASGLPAVVFDVGGPQECIRTGESGFVVAAGDDAGFLARVETLLDDPILAERMGRAARRYALTLTWDTVLDSLMAFYRDIAGADPPRDRTAGAFERDGPDGWTLPAPETDEAIGVASLIGAAVGVGR